MNRIRVVQVITRWVPGGARAVVATLLDRLPPGAFEQALAFGSGEDTPANAVRVPALVRDVNPLSDAKAALDLFWMFLERRPHVVHAHTYKAGMLGSMAARLAGVPAVVLTPHGHIFEAGSRIPSVPGPGGRLDALRRITRAAQSFAHRITALSEKDLEDQVRQGLAARSKYVVVPNGIDVDRFARLEGNGRKAGRKKEFVVGAVGRLAPEKGHAVLVEAFARVRRRRAGARLVLVGSGEREAALRRQVASAGLAASVTFAGARDAAEMLPGMDLFVQPSHYESQGLAVLEAMAAGKPVVATDAGGLGAVVRDGETGVLVPRDDPGAMADAILGLAGDPARARALAGRGRAYVRERFSTRRMVGAYAGLYRRLLGRYNPAPECTTT